METQTALPHILIVDDDPTSQALLTRILSGHYRLSYASSGVEALRQIEAQPFDLMMLDIMMGQMSGLEVLAALRRRPDTVYLPVMLVSALASDADIAYGLNNGANDYITKPFNVHVLRARVQNQINMKRLLDERQQAINYLRDAHEIKDRMLRIATHDLKNPLNNISLAQYYLRSIVGNDPAAIESLDTIEDTVNIINDLVEDFLDSSALESGRTELELESVEMEGALWEVIARYNVTASRKNINLLLGDIEGHALADRARLSQIISNLVSNAIKYSPPGSLVTVSSLLKDNFVRISVADEGPGISPPERSKLFQPFSKLSNRPTAGESSTGLGLWIVKELTQMHEGAVGADFPPGGGSVFWVEIPAAL